MAKRYFWLRLKEDFFGDKRIKKLRKIAGGDTYTIIYLKLMLLSLSNEGIIEYEGVEPTLEEELSLELDEDVDNIEVTVAFLMQAGLMVEKEEGKFMLISVPELIGSESAAAIRGREYRAKLTDEQKAKDRERARLGMQRIREERKNVTQCYEQVTNVDIDIEIEKDKEIDKKENKTKEKSSRVAAAPRVFFENNEELNNTFKDFVDMRKKLKKPMTDRAITLMTNKLSKLAGSDDQMAVAILEQSIRGSWTDIYPLKDSGGGSRDRPRGYSGTGCNGPGDSSIVDKWANAVKQSG